MTKDKSQALFDRFNFFHPEKGPRETLMFFGFECGDGWFDLIWDLCEKIELHLKDKAAEEEPFEVVQVKEKYGSLRFYTNWGTNEISELIEEAEKKSATICEICGKPGKITGNYWLSCICDECGKNK